MSLISVGKYQYIQDPRFRILHEPHAQDWILSLEGVKFSDQGYYECQVNTLPILSHRIYLNVVGKYMTNLHCKVECILAIRFSFIVMGS